MSATDSFRQMLMSEIQALRSDVSQLIAQQADTNANLKNLEKKTGRAAQMWSGIGSAVAIAISLLAGRAGAH